MTKERKEEPSELLEDLEDPEIPEAQENENQGDSEESETLEQEVSEPLIPSELPHLETSDLIQRTIEHENIRSQPDPEELKPISQPLQSGPRRDITASEIYSPKPGDSRAERYSTETRSIRYTPTDEVHRSVQRSDLKAQSLTSDSSDIAFKNPESSNSSDQERKYVKMDKFKPKERRKYPWEA